MKHALIIALTIVFVLLAGPSFAAPMIPTGPMTIEGTIQEISWHPSSFSEGIPGMSGTLGIDRKLAAYYLVTLTDTMVDKSKIADDPYRRAVRNLAFYESGKIIRVTIYHENDDGYLKKGMRIRLVDYEISGDEGGEWVSFAQLEIIGPDQGNLPGSGEEE